MRFALALSVIGVAVGISATGANAQAYVSNGNDTGGIIPWSCEVEAMAQDIASGFCARWDKYARITSVHRRYGDYIAFNCLWNPRQARWALPAVPTRTVCRTHLRAGPVISVKD